MIDKGIRYKNRTGFFLGGGGSDAADYDIGGGGNVANAPSSSAPSPGDTGGEGGYSPKDESTSQYNTGNDGVTYKGPAELGVTTRKENKIKMPEPVDKTGPTSQYAKNKAALDALSTTTYEDLDKNLVPPYIPYSGAINTVGNLLGSFGFEKNRDFFVENVAGKYGYGYGLEDFEQYMEDRLSGKVGAYGNVEQGENALRQPDDRQDTSGILEALLLPELTPTIGPVPEIGFNYIKPYSNQVVVAPGSQGLASLTGGQGFLSSII